MIDQWAQHARDAIRAFSGQTHGGISIEIAFDQTYYTESRLQQLGGNLIAWFLYPGRLWQLLRNDKELSKLTDL